MIFAPSFKIRFELPDVLVYYLPLNIFLLSTLMISIVGRTYFYERLTATFIYFFFFLPPFMAFFIGGAEDLNLLLKITLNCGLGALVVLFPWNLKLLGEFMLAMAAAGAVMATNTILYAGNDAVLELASEAVQIGYLTISFTAGMACIASLFLILRKLSPITISLFVVNWIGLALGRGRGAFLACIIVSAIYLVFYLLNRRSTQGLKGLVKKLSIVVLCSAMAPFIVSKLLSLSQNQRKWNRLLKDFDIEVDQGGRGALAQEALEKIGQHPVFGNGLGEYMMAGGHPHNIFLQFGMDAGIIGMLSIAYFFLTLMFLGVRNFKRLEGQHVNLGYAVTALFLYNFSNLLKSGDSYLGRDLFIISALPIVLSLAIRNLRRIR